MQARRSYRECVVARSMREWQAIYDLTSDGLCAVNRRVSFVAKTQHTVMLLRFLSDKYKVSLQKLRSAGRGILQQRLQVTF
jgi:hypothetical protein